MSRQETPSQGGSETGPVLPGQTEQNDRAAGGTERRHRPRGRRGKEPFAPRSRADNAASGSNVVSAPAADRVRLAVELLREEAIALWGERPPPTRPLRLDFELAMGMGTASRDVAQPLAEALGAAVSELRAEMNPRDLVPCLRCDHEGCGHGTPSASREVFTGYGPTGVPQFHDLAQALLELRDERAVELFGQPGTPLTCSWNERHLHFRLLPSFARRELRVRWVVVCGFFAVPAAESAPPLRRQAMALSFLVVERAASRGPQFELRTVASPPAGGRIDELSDDLGELPWAAAESWMCRALADLSRRGRAVSRTTKKPGVSAECTSAAPHEERLAAIVLGFERRLQRPNRVQERRTRHATQRRLQERPIAAAFADLKRAGDDRVMWDQRRETWIVLGDRGRAHVFTDQGKHVTSLRFTQDVVDRRQRRGVWRAVAPERVRSWRERIAAAVAATPKEP